MCFSYIFENGAENSNETTARKCYYMYLIGKLTPLHSMSREEGRKCKDPMWNVTSMENCRLSFEIRSRCDKFTIACKTYSPTSTALRRLVRSRTSHPKPYNFTFASQLPHNTFSFSWYDINLNQYLETIPIDNSIRFRKKVWITHSFSLSSTKIDFDIVNSSFEN